MLHLCCDTGMLLGMPTNKTQPWKETRPTRTVRFSDSEWEAIGKAAEAAKKTRTDFIRERVLKALAKLGALAALTVLCACGDRTDLLPAPAPDVDTDMAGGKRPLFIPLAGGVASDIDDKLLPGGKSLEITNMQFAQTGKLVKRYGHAQIPATALVAGGNWQSANYQNAIVRLTETAFSAFNQPLSIYSPTKTDWTSPTSDRRSPLTVALTKLATQSASNPRVAFGAGYYYVVYNDNGTEGFFHFDVYDGTTFALVSAQKFVVNASSYDVVFCNGFAVAVVGQVAGFSVSFYTMTPSSLSVTTTNFAATQAVPLAFDVRVKDATTIGVVYTDNATSNAFGVDFVPSTLAATGWALRDATATAVRADLGMSWVSDLGASGKIGLVTASTTQGVRVQWDIPGAGATRQAVSTYNADPAVVANVTQLCGYTTGNSAAGEFSVLVTVGSATLTNNLTKLANRIGGVLTAGFVLYRSVTLLSKVFTYGFQGDYYALFSFPSDVDGNSYALRIPAVTTQPKLSAPQAIFGVGSTGNLNPFGAVSIGLATVIPGADGRTFTTAIGFVNRIGREADGFYGASSFGVEIVRLRFINQTIPTSTGAPIEALDSLMVPGGSIGQFDGINYAEAGFAYSPPQGVITPGASGTMTPSSRYWYCFVYAYQDATGRLWRSAPSIPQFVDLSAIQNSATISVPTLRITGRSTVWTEVYRGAANDDEEFQKVTQVQNVLSVDTVGYSDGFPDTTLAIGEPLYTNGGILPNTTIPGSTFLFVFQNRLWFISADDPTELWFSSPITPKNGPRFNTEWVVRIADEHGGVIAAAPMEDKVIAFKADAAYSWSGDGPDNAGNGAYSLPQFVDIGVGTTEPRSVVSWNDGVFFKSTAKRPGIQMVDRGLGLAKDVNGVSTFGAAVQAYANEVIVSSIMIPEQSQIRFYCRSGRVLVYDLVQGMWSTFLLNLASETIASAVAYNGAAWLDTTSGILQEDTSGATYTDVGNLYPVIVTTPWIEFSAINGFGRLSELIGSGKTLGTHTLTANMYTDFDDATIVNTKSWAETVALTPKWNWEWIPRVQRMSAAKITLTETSATAGFSSEGITAWVGVKPGLARQPTNTRGP